MHTLTSAPLRCLPEQSRRWKRCPRGGASPFEQARGVHRDEPESSAPGHRPRAIAMCRRLCVFFLRRRSSQCVSHSFCASWTRSAGPSSAVAWVCPNRILDGALAIRVSTRRGVGHDAVVGEHGRIDAVELRVVEVRRITPSFRQSNATYRGQPPNDRNASSCSRATCLARLPHHFAEARAGATGASSRRDTPGRYRPWARQRRRPSP